MASIGLRLAKGFGQTTTSLSRLQFQRCQHLIQEAFLPWAPSSASLHTSHCLREESTSSSSSQGNEDEDAKAKGKQSQTKSNSQKPAEGSTSGGKKLNLAKPLGKKTKRSREQNANKSSQKSDGSQEEWVNEIAMYDKLQAETEKISGSLKGSKTENRQQLMSKLNQITKTRAISQKGKKPLKQKEKQVKKSSQKPEKDRADESSDSSDSSDDENVRKELKEASKIVAQALPPDTGKKREAKMKRLEQELMKTASEQAEQVKESETKEETSKRISDLIKSMEIRVPKQASQSKPSLKETSTSSKKPQKKKTQARSPQSWGRQHGSKFHLYEGGALGIFTKGNSPLDSLKETEPVLYDVIDEEMEKEQLELPPLTAYQETMKWTQERKTWTFPIDNEWGMDTEAGVGFHQHVFLNHLITDFPKGPIRHYMELVVAGLSKNPYMTVEEKHGHVDWYRDFFADKQVLVDELIETEEARPAL